MNAMRFLALAVIALALVLAGCGGSSSKSTSTQASSTTASVTTSSPSSSATSSTSSATTTTATTATVAQSGPCRAANLSLAFLGQQGATGKGEIGFALKNISSHGCNTIGYPGVLFLNKQGAGLTTIPTRVTHDFAGSVPIHALVVAPGSTVSFRLFVTHFTSSGATTGCTTAYALQVIPPNDTATLKTAIPQGGAYFCRTVTVSPLQPGTSAYP